MSKKQLLTAASVVSQTLPFLMITATLVVIAFIYGNLESKLVLHTFNGVVI